MITLRDIITEDTNSIWIDNAGTEWSATELLTQWSDDLAREASCVDGRIQWIGADGLIETGDAVLTELESAYTESGHYVVFHSSTAGSPESFETTGWYFQPNDPHGGDDVYSSAYDTQRAALSAAEDWEAEQIVEEELANAE